MSGLTGELSAQDQKEQQLSSLKQSIDRYLADPTTAGLPEAIIAAVQVLLKPLSVSADQMSMQSAIKDGTLHYPDEKAKIDSLHEAFKVIMLESIDGVATTGANTGKIVLSVATENGHFNLVSVLLNEVGVAPGADDVNAVKGFIREQLISTEYNRDKVVFLQGFRLANKIVTDVIKDLVETLSLAEGQQVIDGCSKRGQQDEDECSHPVLVAYLKSSVDFSSRQREESRALVKFKQFHTSKLNNYILQKNVEGRLESGSPVSPLSHTLIQACLDRNHEMISDMLLKQQSEQSMFSDEDVMQALTDPVFNNTQTPLMIAIENGDSNIVKVLFEAGARVSLKLVHMLANGPTDLVKFAKEQLIRAKYDQDSLECLQILRRAGGRYKDAITSAVEQLAGELEGDKAQMVINDCNKLTSKHGGLQGVFSDEHKLKASYIISTQFPILVAYLSIGDTDENYIKKGGSATFSLFKEKCNAKVEAAGGRMGTLWRSFSFSNKGVSDKTPLGGEVRL